MMMRMISQIRWIVLVLGCAGAYAANSDGLGPWTTYRSESIQATFNGQSLTYQTRYAPITLHGPNGEPAAVIYATDYIQLSADSRSPRGVIFIWNGGPSVASTTLHMAGFGPQRLVVPDLASEPIEAPFALEDNPLTLLDQFDLVFVDPPESGLSRALSDEAQHWLYSAEGDAWIMSQFVTEWLAQHQRADAPYYLMGTSYGSIRAAIMVRMLSDQANPPQGAILFSQGVNLIENTQRAMNYVGLASNISQMAAIAWFHGRGDHVEQSLNDVVEQSEQFAIGPYLNAIMQGTGLEANEKDAVAKALAGWLGLDVDLVKDHDLLINKGIFKSALLADQGEVLATNDARYASLKETPGASNPPIMGVASVYPAYFEAIFKQPLDLEAFRWRAPDTEAWDYGGSSALNGERASLGDPRSVFADYDWSGDLAQGFKAREDFKVFIGIGIYDTLTTYGPARLLATHPALPPEHVAFHYYEGGHSFYAHPAVFHELSQDLRQHLLTEPTP